MDATICTQLHLEYIPFSSNLITHNEFICRWTSHLCKDINLLQKLQIIRAEKIKRQITLVGIFHLTSQKMQRAATLAGKRHQTGQSLKPCSKKVFMWTLSYNPSLTVSSILYLVSIEVAFLFLNCTTQRSKF